MFFRHPKRALQLSLMIVMLVLVTGASRAEEKIALVIGNSAYVSMPALPNPARDATLMAKTLRGLNFEVLEYQNLDHRGMKRAFRDFNSRLQQASEDAVALFFYAGHGLQVEGVNYLVPVTAMITAPSDVPIESVNANQLVGILDIAPSKLNFVILDACRNNPFEGAHRSVGAGGATRGGGLARMDAPAGTLIAYSTAPDAVAMDGEGANSPYTSALSDYMRQPGMPVERMFRHVRNAVMEATENAQVPWESSSLTGDDFFFAGAGTATFSMAESAPKSTQNPVQKLAAGAGDFIFWNSIKNSTDVSDFQDYLRQFPSGVFAKLAARRVENLMSPAKVELASVNGNVAWAANRLTAGATFRDCVTCPPMTVVPGGQFLMGAAPDDPDRRPEEGPQRGIGLSSFALSTHEVTRAEYAAFIAETGHEQNGPCWTELENGTQGWSEAHSWRNPGFAQSANHPAVCISWTDAVAYVDWLSATTGVSYRLPTEAEWEFAARAGSQAPRAWKGGADAACAHANGADKTIGLRHADWQIAECSDGFALTAPVGSFAANGFGLQDMSGNVAEWVLDCWVDSLDQLGVEPANCMERSLRGGAFMHAPADLRVSARLKLDQRLRSYITGFRVLREIQ